MSFPKVFATCLVLGAAFPLSCMANPSRAATSVYSFPVPFAGYARFFGWQDKSHKTFNDGIDLLAPDGSLVHAWSQGTVKEISYSPQCGWRIIINYQAWSTEYCNIGGGVSVTVGEPVQAGTVVAKLDKASVNGKSILHWTLRHNGKLMNPYDIIRIMQSTYYR